MLDNLRIGPKLLLAPALVLLLLIISSGGAYYTMVRQNQSFEMIVEHRATRIKDANELVGAAQQAHAKMYQLLAWIGGSFSAPRIDALIQDIHARHLEIEGKFAKMTKNTGYGSAERRFLEQSEAAHAVYVLAILDVIEMSEVDHSISANAMSRAERAFDKVSTRLVELARLEQELSEQASRDAASDFQTVSVLMPVLVLISIMVSLGVSMAVRNAMLREVKEIGQSALDLANGNLTVKKRAYGRDEISETSRALDTSIRNLNLTLKTILDSAREIDSASREIAIGNAGLSIRTGAHASSLVRTSASMEKLSINVSKTADSAQQANRLAASASSIALEGGTLVERLVQTLASIKGSSHKAIEMVGVIDHLACQTSILALNAAVEAARAGEGGRGFATVACEVRSLAQRSALAARDIRELIAKSVSEIDGGSASAAQAGHSMANLASSVQEVGDMIDEISLSSAMQASGISDVSEAIVQLDQMTQKNSELVAQAATAAEGLQHQALTLSKAVALLKLDEAPHLPPPGDEDGRRKGRAHLRLASKRA